MAEIKDNKVKKEITKDMSITEVLENYPETYELMLGLGFSCMGCPMAAMETIEQGCMVHGMNPDDFVRKLNSVLKK